MQVMGLTAFNLKQQPCPYSSHDDHHGRPSDLMLNHLAFSSLQS